MSFYRHHAELLEKKKQAAEFKKAAAAIAKKQQLAEQQQQQPEAAAKPVEQPIPPPPVELPAAVPRRPIHRRAQQKPVEDSYLELCHEVSPLLHAVTPAHRQAMYKALGKRYKRSFKHGLKEMYEGSLRQYAKDKEIEVLTKHQDQIKRMMEDDDMNPYDCAPVANTVYDFLGELAYK